MFAGLLLTLLADLATTAGGKLEDITLAGCGGLPIEVVVP